MHWATSWRYETVDYKRTAGVLENLTVRFYLKNNLRGQGIRILFSNRYGKSPLSFAGVTVYSGNERCRMTCRGKGRVKIIQGEEIYSDAALLEIRPGMDIILEMQIMERIEVNAFCSTWSSKSWHAEYLSLTGSGQDPDPGKEIPVEELFPLMNAETVKPSIMFGLAEVQVLTEEKPRYIYAFGDSITHMSFYTDAVAEWLGKNISEKTVLLNAGICGNRVLRDGIYAERFHGNGSEMGTAGVTRALQMMQMPERPDIAIILEGINDITQPYMEHRLSEKVGSAELCRGLQELVQILKRRCDKVYLGTIMPFQNTGTMYPQQCEQLRLECNRWIRTQQIADGVIDFDRVMRDQVHPEQIRKGFCLPDGVHPNREGGKRMAEEVIRTCFRKGE